jgi:uncharacterized membrane protein
MSFMTWQLAAIIDLLCAAAYALTIRTIALSDPGKSSFNLASIYLFVVTPIALASAIVLNDWSFELSWSVVGLIVSTAVVSSAANLLAFSANSGIDAAQFGIIANSSVIVSIIISYAFLNETLNFMEVIGATLILSAALVVALNKFNRQTLRLDRHTLFAFANASLNGLSVPMSKLLLDELSISATLISFVAPQAIVCVAFAYIRGNRLSDLIRERPGRGIMTAGVFKGAANFSYFYALKLSGNAALIASVRSYKTMLIVLGSILILKERDSLNLKLAAAVLATTGLLISL